MANIRVLGAALAYGISGWGVGSRTIMVGHGLGAHALGEAGQFYLRYNNGAKLPLAHALDPAGPGFDNCNFDLSISPVSLNDVDFDVVQVLHSDGGHPNPVLLVSGVGTSNKLGKCDFWLNAGFGQRECLRTGTEKLIELSTKVTLNRNFFKDVAAAQIETTLCSHSRAVEVYTMQC